MAKRYLDTSFSDFLKHKLYEISQAEQPQEEPQEEQDKETDDTAQEEFKMEKGAEKLTKWIGSTNSVITHTIFFVITFCSPLFGVSFDRMMLILTTVVSLEAIYLSIFIQMSINMNNHNIGALQENIEEISEGIEEIQKEDEEEIDGQLTQAEVLNSIQLSLNDLQKQLNALKKSKRN